MGGRMMDDAMRSGICKAGAMEACRIDGVEF